MQNVGKESEVNSEFNYQAALEHEMTRQHSKLQQILRPEPNQEVSDAIVDMSSLLLAYTAMVQQDISPVDPLSEFDRLMNEGVTRFVRRVLAAYTEFTGPQAKKAACVNLSPKLQREFCEVADLLRVRQVFFHLREHRELCGDPEASGR